MKYVIDVIDYKRDQRVSTTTDPFLNKVLGDLRVSSPSELFKKYNLSVSVNGRQSFTLSDLEDYEGWLVGLERAAAWQSNNYVEKVEGTMTGEGFRIETATIEDLTVSSAVDPSHYRGMLAGLPDYGWIDIESRKAKYKDPAVFLGAVDLQESKYMERLGKKDEPLQERKKSLFYKMYAILYMENGCLPIKADEVHKWIAAMPAMPHKTM